MPSNPLESVHQALGAFLVERGGMVMPGHYGDPVAEHMATRRAAGVFDLGSAAKLRVTGTERLRFLDSVLAADVRGLDPGSGAHALLLTADARVSAEMRLLVDDSAVLLLTASLVRAKVRRALERLIVAADVEIQDVTREYTLQSVQGPRAAEVIAAVLGRPVPDLAPFASVQVETAQFGSVRVVRSPRTGGPGLDVIADWLRAPRLFDALVTAACDLGGCAAGLEALEALRVEAGRPRYGAEMDESSVPLEVARPAEGSDEPEIPGVQLDGGCFLGREALVRHAAVGRPLRQLCGIVFSGRTPPVRGDRLDWEGRSVGSVTSACYSPVREESLAMALVIPAATGPGTALTTADGETGRVEPLPFTLPR